MTTSQLFRDFSVNFILVATSCKNNALKDDLANSAFFCWFKISHGAILPSSNNSLFFNFATKDGNGDLLNSKFKKQTLSIRVFSSWYL